MEFEQYSRLVDSISRENLGDGIHQIVTDDGRHCEIYIGKEEDSPLLREFNKTADEIAAQYSIKDIQKIAMFLNNRFVITPNVTVSTIVEHFERVINKLIEDNKSTYTGKYLSHDGRGENHTPASDIDRLSNYLLKKFGWHVFGCQVADKVIEEFERLIPGEPDVYALKENRGGE